MDESSKMDPTEYFENEASQHTDGGDRDIEASTTTSKSSVTAATERTSSVAGDTLAPLKESSHSKTAGGRNSSAQFSIGISEIDSSYRSNDLQTSMYNRLAATAMEEACERKAQLCCGSCCDLVKGCIISNALQMILLVLLLTITGINPEFVAQFDSVVPTTGALVLGSLGVAAGAMGIFGALKFYKYPVLMAGVWCLVQLVVAIINKKTALSLGTAIFSYSNIHLFLALHSGNITAENYKRTERYCCFCTPKRDEDDCCA